MPNKYNAEGIEDPDYGHFDSAKEHRRWYELMLMQRAGEISGLERQKKYMVIPPQDHEKACFYIADFAYRDKTGNMVVEDVKGYKGGAAYQLFVVKRKLMLWTKGIKVVEV